jgi:hypothetical protein
MPLLTELILLWILNYTDAAPAALKHLQPLLEGVVGS